MTDSRFLQKDMQLYIGEFDLTGISRVLDKLEGSTEPVELGNWGDAVTLYISDGVQEIGLRGYQALMDDAVTDLFLPAGSTEYITVLLCAGATPAVGDIAYSYTGVLLDDAINIDSKKAVFQASSIPADASFSLKPWGYLIYPKATISATGSGASIDNAAGTTAGYFANLHIISSDSGEYEFKLEQSTNGTDWTDLDTFTSDGSAAASETLVGITTVGRYVRFTATKTAGSCVAVCSFIRQ